MTPGINTSEFKTTVISILTGIVTLVIALGYMTPEEGQAILAGIALATVTIASVSYGISRTILKAQTAVQEQGITEFVVESVALDYDPQSLAELGTFLRDLWSNNPAQDADDWAGIVQLFLARVQDDANESLSKSA